jgi:hypothetical protein
MGEQRIAAQFKDYERRHASAETVTYIAFAHLLLMEINPVSGSIARSDHESMTQG